MVQKKTKLLKQDSFPQRIWEKGWVELFIQVGTQIENPLQSFQLMHLCVPVYFLLAFTIHISHTHHVVLCARICVYTLHTSYMCIIYMCVCVFHSHYLVLLFRMFFTEAVVFLCVYFL